MNIKTYAISHYDVLFHKEITLGSVIDAKRAYNIYSNSDSPSDPLIDFGYGGFWVEIPNEGIHPSTIVISSDEGHVDFDRLGKFLKLIPTEERINIIFTVVMVVGDKFIVVDAGRIECFTVKADDDKTSYRETRLIYLSDI